MLERTHQRITLPHQVHQIEPSFVSLTLHFICLKFQLRPAEVLIVRSPTLFRHTLHGCLERVVVLEISALKAAGVQLINGFALYVPDDIWFRRFPAPLFVIHVAEYHVVPSVVDEIGDTKPFAVVVGLSSGGCCTGDGG